MTLLLASLIYRGDVPDELLRVADGLLANMPILFVPAGAGLIAYLDLFQRHWLVVVIGVAGGTFVTLGATALVVHFLAKRPPATEVDARAMRELPTRSRS
jgi:holin-like protein